MRISEKPLEPIAETNVTSRIRAKLDLCARNAELTLIFGETGRGKTLTARRWCRENPQAVYLELRAASTLGSFIRQLAKKLTGSAKGAVSELKERIDRHLSENSVCLVIDEAHQLMLSSDRDTVIRNIEYIRLDLYEQTGTAVALIFTEDDDKTFNGSNLRGYLEQFLGRGLNKLSIPPRLFGKSEITPIVKMFQPNPSEELIRGAITVAGGIGKIRGLVKHLRTLRKMVDAKPDKYQFTGSRLIEIQDRFETGGKWEED
ncbi:MAG: AAA family ATPase [Candidatus Pacebacteria bacterium]|nr:AAA family ATPase [Candidatus Paceibacterota bacterium]